jgi:hypothetical protein
MVVKGNAMTDLEKEENGKFTLFWPSSPEWYRMNKEILRRLIEQGYKTEPIGRTCSLDLGKDIDKYQAFMDGKKSEGLYDHFKRVMRGGKK